MAAVQEHAAAYFASMNSMAKKIMKEQENLRDMYQNEWEELDFDKREELIDNFIVDSTVREFYKDHPKADEVPQYFPKLIVDSGEKIIIDFDNDGWSWQDEHSSPFSWETKSQMNMPMNEAEEDSKAAKLRKIKRPKSPKMIEKRQSGSSLSPALKSGGASGIWNSPFIAADRGDEADFSGKPEDEHQSEVTTVEGTSDQNTGDAKPFGFSADGESSEDIFKKYGISFGSRASPARSIDKGWSPARSLGDRSSPSKSTGDRSSPSKSSASGERSSPSRFGRLSPKRVINKKPKDREMEKSLINTGDDFQGVVNLALSNHSDSDTEKSENVSVNSTKEQYGVINYGQNEDSVSDFSQVYDGVNLGSNLNEKFGEKFSEMQITDAPETDLIDEPSPRGSLYDNYDGGDDGTGNVDGAGMQSHTSPIESGVLDTDKGSTEKTSTGFDFLDNW